MAVNAELSKVKPYFNKKSKNSIKGNVSVDVYMYYHDRGVFFYLKNLCGIINAFYYACRLFEITKRLGIYNFDLVKIFKCEIVQEPVHPVIDYKEHKIIVPHPLKLRCKLPGRVVESYVPLPLKPDWQDRTRNHKLT